jgi:hypothetical protein
VNAPTYTSAVQQQRGAADVDHNTEGFQQASTAAHSAMAVSKTPAATATAANITANTTAAGSAMSDDDDVLSSIMDEDYLIWASVMEAAPLQTSTSSSGNSTVSVPWSPFLDGNNNSLINNDGTVLDLSPSPLNFNSKGLLPASYSGNDITNDVLVLPPSISQMSHHQQQQQQQQHPENSGSSSTKSAITASNGSSSGTGGKATMLSLDIDDINSNFSSSSSNGNDAVSTSTSCFFEDPLRRSRYVCIA